MTRRSKTALLAAVAVLAVPAMTACVLQSDGSDTEPTTPQITESETVAESTTFASTADFFAALEADYQACAETDEQPMPEGLDTIEPKLAGGLYAFCNFEDGSQVIAILLADANEPMVDTQLASDRDIADFKREGGVTSLTIGGNWLITSPDDAVVADLAEIFGGEIY